MSITKSSLNRTYERGKRISPELFALIINSIVELGGDPLTGIIPHGVISSVSKKLKVAHITVKGKWNLFVEYGYDIPKPKPGPPPNIPTLLSDEDVDYIRDIVSIKPTIYHREIRQLLVENTNSTFTNVSLSTIKHAVCHRLSIDKPWTRKKITRSNLYWWNEPNLIYTRAFFRHVSTLDVYNIRFLDESSFHLNTCLRHYGSAR